MPGPFVSRDVELFVQLEATWGASPGALAGTDAFKHTSGKVIKKEIARLDRTQDKDNGQPSVVTTQKGREKSTLEPITTQMIPSGVDATPTEPDVDPLLEAHFGQKHKATAHTTTAAGSTGTTLNLTPGGGAASGIQIGDLIAVDYAGSGDYEVRRVVNIATDVVTVNLAFTSNPAAARAVKVGTTYKFLATALKSVSLWEFINGNNFRHQALGVILPNFEAKIDFANKTPSGEFTWSDGAGKAETTHATSRPTPTTAGVPLVPTVGKAWIGATQGCVINASFKSNNGLQLRETESCSLGPTGQKRTDNDSRYSVEAMLAMFLTTGGAVEGYYDNASTLTAYDLLVQLGSTVGQMVAWNLPNFIPDAGIGDQDNEVTLELSGKAYATAADDEIYLAFI